MEGELGVSLEMIAAVAGLAVLDMLSPAVAATTMYVLLRRRSGAFGLLTTYLGTVAVAYFLLGAGLMFGLSTWFDAVGETTIRWGQAVLGAALLVGSWWVPTERKPDRGVDSRPLGRRRMVVLGLGTWVVEFGTALPFFGAVAMMLSADVPIGQWVPVLAGYVAIMIAPGLLIFAGWRLAGDTVRGRLEQRSAKLATGSRAWLPWLVGIAGFLVLRDAVAHLLD
ncbi:hypothetical protein GCM10010522_46450 [Kribbella solani]